MKDNADRAQDLLASRREHSKGDGNFPTPEPHMGLRDESPEDRGPRDLRKDRDDRSAPKGDVPAGQGDRNPDQVTRAARRTGNDPNPPGGMELVKSDLAQSKRKKPEPKRPNARRSSAAKREAVRGKTSRGRGKTEPTQAAKAKTAKDRAVAKRPRTAQGGKKADQRTSSGRGRAGRRS